jgi:diguanylate cyclase (GGDEF)-like protein/PAS domain S-box-containing protein
MTPRRNPTGTQKKKKGAPSRASLKVHDCIVLIAGDNDLYVDKNFLQVFGYHDPAHVSEKPFSMLVHPDDRDRIEEINRRRKEGEDAPSHFDFKGICRDGSTIHVEASATSLKHNGQTLSAMYLRDVTTRKHWEEELRASEEKYRNLFENSMDAIYISSRDGALLEANGSFLNLFGYTREEAMKLNTKDAFTLEDRERFIAAMQEKGFVTDFEVKLARKDGTLMDCLLSLNPRIEGGKTVGYQGIVRDITAYKRAEEALQYMAYHDSLTGLPNRMLFRDRLNMALLSAGRNKKRVAVMVLDLDKFKEVNDTLGHDMGDRLLKAVADRLVETVRKGDTVARMGGDEFLLIVPEMNSLDDAITVKDKIMDAFQATFLPETNGISVLCSIGIAIYPEHGRDADTLVRCADMAMFKAKQGGRNSFQLCDL